MGRNTQPRTRCSFSNKTKEGGRKKGGPLAEFAYNGKRSKVKIIEKGPCKGDHTTRRTHHGCCKEDVVKGIIPREKLIILPYNEIELREMLTLRWGEIRKGPSIRMLILTLKCKINSKSRIRK